MREKRDVLRVCYVECQTVTYFYDQHQVSLGLKLVTLRLFRAQTHSLVYSFCPGFFYHLAMKPSHH